MLIVDAANVVGSRPDGWWRDRAAAAARFVTSLRAAGGTGAMSGPVVVVLEGAARRGVPVGRESGVEVVHAPGGGDDEIVRRAAAAVADGCPVRVVTADRGLSARVRSVGSEVVGPRWLLDRLGGPAGDG